MSKFVHRVLSASQHVAADGLQGAECCCRCHDLACGGCGSSCAAPRAGDVDSDGCLSLVEFRALMQLAEGSWQVGARKEKGGHAGSIKRGGAGHGGQGNPPAGLRLHACHLWAGGPDIGKQEVVTACYMCSNALMGPGGASHPVIGRRLLSAAGGLALCLVAPFPRRLLAGGAAIPGHVAAATPLELLWRT